MTLATALYGGGGSGTKYRAGNLYLAAPGAIGTTASSINVDTIIPFSPRLNMTLDRVAWYRDNTNAGNVYVGLYSSAGVLLTDCALDNDTTAGWHLVDTTNVALTANEFYWLCWNASADVAGTQTLSTSDAVASLRPTYEALMEQYGLAIGIGGTSTDMRGTAQAKTRTNAALLATLTMSGWAQINDNLNVPVMGVIPA